MKCELIHEVTQKNDYSQIEISRTYNENMNSLDILTLTNNE